VLVGGTGTGKTHLAIAIARSYESDSWHRCLLTGYRCAAIRRLDIKPASRRNCDDEG
jgi:hypothetical protein